MADYGENGWAGSYRPQKNDRQTSDGQATASRIFIVDELRGYREPFLFPGSYAQFLLPSLLGFFHEKSVMNLKQKIALGLGAANLALIWLFPPFNSFSFTDIKAPIFAGFHFRFMVANNETVNGDVLFLEIAVLLINVVIAWLLLRDVKNLTGSKKYFNYQNAILFVVAVNLTLILLFPPFQFFYAVTSALLPSFQGFYFIFMAGPMLSIVTPILYLEVVFVLFNGVALWLLFNRVKERQLTPQQAAELMRKLSGGKN
jgi:hypothetical protein